MPQTIYVHDKMQSSYSYELSQPTGQNFDPNFNPELSPKELLELGIFGGVYMRDCIQEFPLDWTANAKFANDKRDTELNFFKVNASQPLWVWQQKGWIHQDDPRGWFQWYCRYYYGRRHPDDQRQIKRWIAFKRHLSQLKNNCFPGDWNCHRKQRQALLHWAYDSRKY